jgi:hypothetical protein
MLPMPGYVDPMARCECRHALRSGEPQKASRCLFEPIGHHDGAVVGHGDEAAVESRVQIRSQQETIEHVEALGVAGTARPRLDVARAQQLGHGEAGDGTAAFPVFEKAGAENVLADALDHQTLGLGRARQAGGLLLEGVEQLVRQGLRELEGPPDEAVQRRKTGDSSSGDRALGKKGAGRGAQVERRRDIALRECDQEQSSSRRLSTITQNSPTSIA